MRLSMAHPKIYLFCQGILGAIRARRVAMAEYVQFSKGDRILDIGCGPGYVSQYFKDTQYVGFDTENSYIDYANRKYGHLGSFYCSEFDDEASTQFEAFDIVIMNGLLHHLPDKAVEELLLRARRVLKPQGRLVSLDCYYDEEQSFLIKKMLGSDRGKFIRKKEDYIALVSKVFESVAARIRDDLLFVPYPIIILQVEK